MSSFEEVVADWLRTRGEYVESVTKVVAYGSDWEGDTESGFHDAADVTIFYSTPHGQEKQQEVSGEDMADLWNFVMKSWPTTPSKENES